MDAEGLRHRLGQHQVEIGFLGRLVQRRQRGAGKLELAARFERDSALPGRALQADDGVTVPDRVGAELAGDAVEQGADAVRPAISHRTQRIGVEHVLFVLGADAPMVLGLGAVRQRLDHLGARFDRGRVVVGAGHGNYSGKRSAEHIAGQAESNPFIANRR